MSSVLGVAAVCKLSSNNSRKHKNTIWSCAWTVLRLLGMTYTQNSSYRYLKSAVCQNVWQNTYVPFEEDNEENTADDDERVGIGQLTKWCVCAWLQIFTALILIILKSDDYVIAQCDYAYIPEQWSLWRGFSIYAGIQGISSVKSALEEPFMTYC